ncbi:Trafficking protein particle complex subunit 10-like Protein [Tribolium castaneum]|uniref:Trafficking protein particle complex subunit 10-like Protein n=1 Tax=Tribolium castaneum TaxID=7070 RepID=A0A139WBM0_TRICA|nr:Trafficking protein particle complex subunit 10-like Protein [Tribolium castaneum]
MNGTAIDDGSTIDRRPLITCAGELEVFSTIEDNLSQALPQDSCEWRRSLGRPVRSVHIGANFAPFSAAALPKGAQWDLIRYPLFHIYWTECTDVDLYKNTVRDDIENWLKELQTRDIPDFLVVVVENYDGKRTNKLLPRTTVLDKIRTDFAPKQGDRCISVINPGKVEARSADSWRGLVSRIRHLLLVAYARAVSRLEDHVRQQRERRNEIGWNFMQYFHLQEELAHVLEMLGVHEEALVQYDELDALFSQFVVNGITGESINWLGDFQKPLEQWHGLKINHSTMLSESPSLLELRAYLFAKQAQMLLKANKVWEMASRCLPFLHLTTREITVLEINSPPGAVSCWLFLACVEVLQVCDKYNNADAVEDYSLHTACLWAYASEKLRDLGELCGLMPGGAPTSEQLHTVVGLSAGMGDNPGAPDSPSPTDKLKEALCSQEAFKKTYLELAELAMCTYKHIGRLRSARLVGREVASFYLLLGETQTAAAFLSDAVRTFEQDKWHELAAQTQIELAECYRKANDTKKFIKTSASVAAALEIDTLIRWSYFDEMRKCLQSLEHPLVVPFNDIIKITSVALKNEAIILQDSTINVELVIESNFPREILCTNVQLSIELDTKEGRKSEKYSKSRVLTGKDLKPRDPLLQRLQIFRHLDLKQDKTLASASVVCKHPEHKRKDSAAAPPKSDFQCCLQVANLPLVVTPGVNVIRLSKQATNVGKHYLGQMAIFMKNLHLISQLLTPRVAFEVKEEAPVVRLHKTDAPLLSGFEQIMNLIITIGSYTVEPKSRIKLTASRGLSFQTDPSEPLTTSLEIELGERPPFSSTRTPLRVLADLLTKDHQVSISCPWTSKPIVVKLSFTPPLTTIWRLNTVQHRKFVQINVTGQCEKDIYVEKPQLSVGDFCKIVDRNHSSSHCAFRLPESDTDFCATLRSAKPCRDAPPHHSSGAPPRTSSPVDSIAFNSGASLRAEAEGGMNYSATRDAADSCWTKLYKRGELRAAGSWNFSRRQTAENYSKQVIKSPDIWTPIEIIHKWLCFKPLQAEKML